MADEIQKVQETTTQAGNTVQTTKEVSQHDIQAEAEHPINVAERVVWYVAGVLLFLLGFRFLLSLLGANPSNSFANFIYATSHPFVAPFFSLFNYNYSNGVSHFEIYTLVAMLFYALVAWGIARLVTINRREA
ncbi:MAG TPA: YggT family protein [Candidatus Saccharimonadales bacterium]|nr:YggT family protein [Candidatus Saccharimonadales bacterium]